MAEFYVLVSQMKNKGRLSLDLCGKLWAENRRTAEMEAAIYRDSPELNAGLDMEWLIDDWYIVTVATQDEASSHKGYKKFCKRRVTPELKGSLTLWLDQPDWEKIAATNSKRLRKMSLSSLLSEPAQDQRSGSEPRHKSEKKYRLRMKSNQ